MQLIKGKSTSPNFWKVAVSSVVAVTGSVTIISVVAMITDFDSCLRLEQGPSGTILVIGCE